MLRASHTGGFVSQLQTGMTEAAQAHGPGSPLELGDAVDRGRPAARLQACAREGAGAGHPAPRPAVFITECFKGGASAPTVQQLPGHLHLSVTQRYAHTNDNLKT